MLHTVNKSPFERNAFNACLARTEKGGGILLFEDAVYAVIKNTTITNMVTEAARNFKVYVLGPDLKARGYDKSQVIDGITIVEYDDFVDIVVACGPVIAWL